MLSRYEIKTLLLIANRPDSILAIKQIPKELILQNIGQINSERLLMATIEADYFIIIRIVIIAPELIFAELTALDIDGTSIKNSPLQYALFNLDTYAWYIFFKVIQKYEAEHPEYRQWLKQQVNQVTTSRNLEFLYQSYLTYNQAFDSYELGTCSIENLRQTWLTVGNYQRHNLPRHMIREMCLLHQKSILFFNPLLLLTFNSDESINLKYLRQLAESHMDKLIIVKQGEDYYRYQLNVYYDLFKTKLTNLSDYELEFLKQLDFPRLGNYRIKDVEFNTILDHNLTEHGPWQHVYSLEDANNPDFPPRQITAVIHAVNEKPVMEPLFPINQQELGQLYTLARGAAAVCIAIDNPLGHNQLLKHRALHDLGIFKSLEALRIAERNNLAKVINLSNHHGLS